MYDTSLAIREGGLNGCEEARRRRGRRIFKTLEALLCAAGIPAREEIEVVAFR